MELVSWQGDTPNFFFRLELPESLSEFFCLSGVSAVSKLKPPPTRAGLRFVGNSGLLHGLELGPVPSPDLCGRRDFFSSSDYVFEFN